MKKRLLAAMAAVGACATGATFEGTVPTVPSAELTRLLTPTYCDYLLMHNPPAECSPGSVLPPSPSPFAFGSPLNSLIAQ